MSPKYKERMFSIMKKIIAILMSLLIVVSLAAVSASALDAAQTAVKFNKGDEVIYTLKLTVPKKVVGCDFSVYYDSSMLKVKEVADYTGNYDEEEHQAVINPNLKDEVIGNWSILSGVSFDNRTLVSVKFEAINAGTSNISYYVRYMYPSSLEQFTDYTFKCDVKVNGSKVIDNEAPELNTTDKQSQGLFVNSVTGDGEDADVNMAGGTTMESGEGDVNGGDAHENTPNNSGNNNTKKDDKKDNKKSETVKPAETKADDKTVETTVTIISGDATADSVVATPSQTADNGGIFTSVWFWVIIALVVAGGGVGAFYYTKNKKTKAE